MTERFRADDTTPGAQALRVLASLCTYRTAELALALSVSERQLRRQFQKAFGCAPQSWLRDERLNKARHLLATASSVKEVAYTLGFTQPSQFCRDFKRKFGVTPSACARRARAA